MLIALVAGGFIFWSKRSNDDNSSKSAQSSVSVPAPIAANSKLSAADVAKLDKDASFWGYFKNAAMQQQLVTDHKDYSTDKTSYVTYRKLGFDYGTKKLVTAVDQVDNTLNGYRTKNRCYDGKDYFKSGPSAWRDVTEPAGTSDPICDMTREPLYYITDGTNAGGLTEAQANTFVSYLQGKQGLGNVRLLKLEEHGGKQYLHYTVDFVPIPTYGSYGANFWFGTAIKAAGVDSDKLPYGKSGAIGAGTHLEYYIDPATSLPGYSKTSALPLKDSNGKDEPLDDFHVVETIYHFGTSTFDANTSNNADLTFDW